MSKQTKIGIDLTTPEAQAKANKEFLEKECSRAKQQKLLENILHIIDEQPTKEYEKEFWRIKVKIVRLFIEQA